MRIFVNEYTKVLAYTFIGLLFSYCSFFLIINIYHYQEVRKAYDNDVSKLEAYTSINNNIDLIKKNLNVNVDNYKGTTDKFDMLTLQQNLSSCVDDLDSENLKKIINKKSINIKNVEKLRELVSNDVVNKCLIEKLYYVTYNNSNIKFLTNDAVLVKMNIDTINSELEFINNDIINNSSLYFNTTDFLKTIDNKVGNNYNNLLNLYKRSSDVVLALSSKFNQEVKNNG